MIKKILIIIAIILTFCSCSNNKNKIAPKAVKGVLDLRNWDFEKDGIVNLDGEWEFYWQQFLTSKEFDTINKKHYIQVPSDWKGYEWDNKILLPQDGFVSLKLKLVFNKISKNLVFKILNMGTAYRFFVNDSLNGSNGTVGKNRNESTPQFLSKIYSLQNTNDTINIIAQVSNYHYRKGGLWTSILLGNEINIRHIRDFNLIIDCLAGGGFLLMGLNLIILFLFRRAEMSSLFFGIQCFIAFIRTISVGERIITEVFPWISWELLIKFELIPFYLALPVACIYFYFLFPNQSSKIFIKILSVVCIFNLITALFTNAIIHSQLVTLNQISSIIVFIYLFFITVKALKNKEQGSLLNLFSIVFYLLALINSFLFYSNILNTFDTASIGMIFFVIVHLILNSRRFSYAYRRVENFANELKIEVDIKTKDLRIEKEKSDKLLLNVLPEPIAFRLKEGETQIADHFDEASVVFIDIVDFTKLSAKSTPQAMVKMLNEIFTIFDKIAAKYTITSSKFVILAKS